MIALLNILNNWKLYLLSFALFCALSLIVVQRFQLAKRDNKILVCEGSLVAYNMAINAAKQASDEQERQLRLREQEAARMRAQSQKRMDDTMEYKISDDGVNEFLLEEALGFTWKNNIP